MLDVVNLISLISSIKFSLNNKLYINNIILHRRIIFPSSTRKKKKEKKKSALLSRMKKIFKNLIRQRMNVPKSILIFAHSLHYTSLHTFEQKKSRSPYICTLLNNSLPDVLINYAWWKKKIMKKKKKKKKNTTSLF